ncbi:MAG: MBL fold metallo-hydrolase [Deltaproteobacteria bacterium]|nr:MBL fold metallo-hydrolase [Deltaproteobacteria bacterium]MBI4795452.1 MBL fold metallo-hydrolase [Deltaproteobacteria bacterium]
MTRQPFTPKPPPEEVRDFGPLKFIPGKKGGRYPYCHSLVIDGEETWVVDPAGDKDYLRHLAQTRRVTGVFISHFHEDHQKYNYLFPQARFYVPAPEAEAFRSLEAAFALMGLDDPQAREYWGEIMVKDFNFRPLENLVPYEPGQRFQQGKIVLEIVPAPGHTLGHSCFYFPGQEALFLADVDLTPFGPWYGDKTSSLEDFEATLERLAGFKARTYITAHEQGVFSEEEFQAALPAYRQTIAAREDRLLELLQTPKTVKQLADRHFFYGKPKDPPFIYHHIETQMLAKHLERLLTQARVSHTDGFYLAKK